MNRGNAYDLFAYLPVYSAAEACFQAIMANVDGYRNYFVASKDNLEQRPGREIVEQEMADLPCRKPIEELDTLVDCSKVVAELGWDQPQSLDESLAKYKGRESIKPYDCGRSPSYIEQASFIFIGNSIGLLLIRAQSD